ncbi:MAG: ABC transporter permease, partial [Limisphaerales bacterium]
MNRILTISALTWKAAFRYRLFWLLSGLLVAAVVGLPLLIKDDGTAQGLTQILLTYTLSAITAILGFATLWIACGSLARDIEECQMQMVTTKPISRWQIWVGKWLGILGLNAVLLAISGGAVFFLLTNRASHLPADQQNVLRQGIFVARASLKQPAPDYAAEADSALQEARKANNIPENEIPEVRKMLLDRIKSGSEVVPPGYMKRWTIDAGILKNFVQDKPLQLRVRFRTSRYNDGETYPTLWVIGDPDSPSSKRITQILPPESFQEFNIPNVIDNNGKLTIDVANPPANGVDLLFDANDGLEV